MPSFQPGQFVEFDGSQVGLQQTISSLGGLNGMSMGQFYGMSMTQGPQTCTTTNWNIASMGLQQPSLAPIPITDEVKWLRQRVEEICWTP